MFEYEIDISPNSYTIDNSSIGSFNKLPLYVGGYGYYESGPGHWGRGSDLPYIHLIYTLSGAGIICNETLGETHRLTANTAVAIACFYPGDVLMHCTVSDEPWVWKWLRIEGVGIQGYAAMFGRSVHPVAVHDPEMYDSLFDSIEKSIMLNSPTARAHEVVLVSRLLAIITESVFGNTVEHMPENNDSLSKLAFDIQAKPQLQYTLQEMAEMLKVSQYTLIRMFKSLYNVTPYQFIQKCRIAKAENLLRITNMNIEAIAEECGFYDAANMTRCFKKKTGYTPAVYRKMILRMNGISPNGTQITW